MNISVVVPLFNEDESLPELCAWIDKVMQKNNFTYEVLLIDDGSKDKSWEVVEKISSEFYSFYICVFSSNLLNYFP